ncbi:hypothetical protein GPECTOR_87g418 [Gonium pectorale]|uniref:Uncharacterized protein n=1 Tax=Gonium pectorale TaxID=33097 RepID=A0A150G103_GONPE|nr:hypothetical protein GPECTOR_87g418 [Gonium pectorale]|eukprot:KXZ43556.1 hypothetical protein GPECTOR_87g418 [Gonium pectorale]
MDPPPSSPARTPLPRGPLLLRQLLPVRECVALTADGAGPAAPGVGPTAAAAGALGAELERALDSVAALVTSLAAQHLQGGGGGGAAAGPGAGPAAHSASQRGPGCGPGLGGPGLAALLAGGVAALNARSAPAPALPPAPPCLAPDAVWRVADLKEWLTAAGFSADVFALAARRPPPGRREWLELLRSKAHT